MSTSRAGCSYRTPSRPQPVKVSPLTRRKHSHLSPSSWQFSSGPSPALLSILAAIAASTSPVHGSPAPPPPFLCPSLSNNPVVPNIHSRAASPLDSSFESAAFSPPSPAGHHYPGDTRHIPDKYEQGHDGRWRRVDAYTLYGSTVCPACREPTNSVTVDDQIQGAASPTADPSAAASSSAAYDIRDALPPGWKPPTSAAKTRTTLILALSLVLAFFICFFIIGCIFWRKSLRRKRKQDDIERKARRRRQDDGESLIEKEARAKQKVWARATARWKENVRYSALQRRGKRNPWSTRISYPQNPSMVLERAQTTPSRASTPPLSSRPLSRVSSIESLHASSVPVEVVIDSLLSPEQDESTPSHTVPPSPLLPMRPHTLPPAYHRRISASTQGVSDMGAGQSISGSAEDSGTTTDDMDSQSLPLHGHVATDDKRLLARLAEQASFPPDSPDMSQGGPSNSEVSVPVWEDEELEHFGDHSHDPDRSRVLTSNQASGSPPPPPLFPPPPPKGKMSAQTFYDYPYAFEDITLEPEPGPAAPPFEEAPSAPPVSGIDLIPSAPPLMDDAYYSESHSAMDAPDPLPLEDTEKEGSCGQVNGTPTDHSQEHYTTISSSNNLAPIVQGPVSSDGTPPCYYS